MKKEEIAEVQALYEQCKEDFTCAECKVSVMSEDCKDCPIYVSHFDND